jgi:hypothetical protein
MNPCALPRSNDTTNEKCIGRGMFQSLERLRGLISRPAHTYRPTVETFPDLDTQRLSKEMELAKKGQSRGAQNQPPSDSTSMDAVETEIIEHIGASQKRAHDALENHLAGFRQRLIDLDFDTQFSNIKSAALGGLSDLKQELQTGVDDLHGLRRDLTAHEKWYDSFQKKHRLERPAKIGSPRASFFKWALIVVLVLVELVLNGELLSKGSELGLVGGIVEALIFAVLNVGVGLMFGIFWIPFVNHRNWFLKLFGLIGLAAYLACMVGINIALAHYREVAGVLFEGAGEAVMQRLMQDPLGIQDFRSWLLFGLGVLFSIIAVLDGLSLRDPYPGYQRIDKALRTAREKYADMRRAAIEELGEVRKDYEELLTTARSDLGKQKVEHDAIVSHRSRMLSLFDEHQTQLEKATNALLRDYRDANVAKRNTPAPARFGEAYTLQRITVTISKEGEWNSSDLKASISEAQAEVDSIFIALGREFDGALEAYRKLDDIAPDQP